MKIIELQAQNFQGLKAVQIKPDGSMVEITGKNGSGKTSTINAIWAGLAGAKGIAQPVRNGADKAVIKLDMGDLVVERIINGKGSRLTVTSAEGARYPSPQTMLNELVGALTFDPMKFAGMKPGDQRATLCELLGIDLATIDYEIDEAFEKRKEVAAAARRARAAADEMKVEGEAPEDSEDADDLIARITKAMEDNAAVEARSKKRAEAKKRADELRRQIEELENEADKLEAKLAKAPALPNLIDVETLKERLTTSQASARSRQQWEIKRAKEEEAQKLETEAAMATAALEQLRQQKADMIDDADMPVPELGIDDSGVTYNGIPFAQASTAQRLRTSCALAMKQNPDLRIIRIENGNDLDEDNLGMLQAMAEADDYQIWIERIAAGTEASIQIVDGEVAA